jgi:hypothetical protein
MILAHKRGTGEVAQVKRFDQCRRYMPVRETFFASLDRQRAEVEVGKDSKRGFARANHGDRSHAFSLSENDGNYS